ncbi:hypothetical protein BC629DRAFT_1537000 [Irpex lacteus]|nr:hypothetical protein BC629DRAFT_1537000 [Irpex lacteus]
METVAASTPRAGGANAAHPAVPSRHIRSDSPKSEHQSADSFPLGGHNHLAGTRRRRLVSRRRETMWPSEGATRRSGIVPLPQCDKGTGDAYVLQSMRLCTYVPRCCFNVILSPFHTPQWPVGLFVCESINSTAVDVPGFTQYPQHYSLSNSSVTPLALRTMDTNTTQNTPAPTTAPDPAAAQVVVDFQSAMAATAGHIDAFLDTIEAYSTSLTDSVRATALDPASATTKLSRSVGLLFNAWTAQVEAFEGQVETLFPPFVKRARTQLADAKKLVLQLEGRLKVLEGMKPSNDPVLMERLGGIATKMAALSDRYQKAGGPAREIGLTGSVHAPGTGGDASRNDKGKKRPAIFGEAPPPKRQASTNETQRTQEAFPIPRDWDWAKIALISPLMEACKGRIPPESALAIATAFEFRPRPSPADNPTPNAHGAVTYASATATPAVAGGPPGVQPQRGATTAPATNTPQTQKPKPKAPVVHVPAPKDPTKLLRAVFSAAVTDVHHRRTEQDIRDWVKDHLQRIGEEPNEVVGVHWHEGGVHVDIRFQSRPTVATRDRLNQESVWLANVRGTARSATVDFYTPITRIAVKALRTHHTVTAQELSHESIIAAIVQENTWLTDCVLSHIQSPRPFWLDTHGGSGTFVFSAYDNRDGSVSAGWCKKKLRVFGVDHTICRHDTTPRVPLCDKCWHWQHTGSQCHQGKLFCSKCSLPHVDSDHPRFCVHPDCKQARLDTLNPRTECVHVYCANCDSMEHAPSARECPFNRHASDRDAVKGWFSKNPPKFSAGEMHQRGKAYDGNVAVEVERRRRESEGVSTEEDVGMNAA